MARTVHRTARIRLRPTRGQRRRLFGLLRSAGDVWAWVLDCNRQLRAWGMAPVANYQALCRELSGVAFGELGVVGARSVLKRYAQAWFEAAARRRGGQRAGFPRRKRALVPVRYYHATFELTGCAPAPADGPRRAGPSGTAGACGPLSSRDDPLGDAPG